MIGAAPDAVGESRHGRLARLARARSGANTPSGDADAGAQTAAAIERCELCATVILSEHRHLLDTAARRLVCACRACVVLFDGASSAGRTYRLIPDRVRLLAPDRAVADLFWAELAVPVDLAFFFFDTVAGRTVALYPGPMGATESQLSLDAWTSLAAADPALRGLATDVEALLVNRTRGRVEHWIVPIDVCYTVAGLIRSHWKGLGGGDVVWAKLDGFFERLRANAEILR